MTVPVKFQSYISLRRLLLPKSHVCLHDMLMYLHYKPRSIASIVLYHMSTSCSFKSAHY
jgi:hypothetical protein